MFAKNRVGMLLAAAVLSFVFAAGTPARAADALTGVWNGSWHDDHDRSNLHSTLDFNKGMWDTMYIVAKHHDPFEDTYSFTAQYKIENRLYRVEVVVSNYDEFAGILDIQFAVYEGNNATKINGGGGQFFR